MNLNQLTVFHEVMMTGSLSQAARNLGRTQPAISLALKGLEDLLGFALFQRKGRALVPVPEARYLLDQSTDILARLEQVNHTLHNLKSRQTGTLNVAVMPGPSALLFPRFVCDLIGARRDVRLTLTTRSSPQIVQMVSSQSIDFGFADSFGPPPATGQFQVDVTSAACLCALPARHALAEADVVTASDLDGLPMGMLLRDHFSHTRTQAVFDAAGAALNIRLESQNYLPVFPFVAAGHCISVVDPLSAETYDLQHPAAPDVVFRRFEPTVRFDYAVYTPAHRPLSLIASEVINAWKAELLAVLGRQGVLLS